ncbi:hypothetical protein BJX99DRAFT_234171 [Aspergillus californicus]
MHSEPVLIKTLKRVTDLVDWATGQDTHLGDSIVKPPVYIDIQGECLGRDGKISLMPVLMYPGDWNELACIIDIHKLGSAAFSAAGQHGKTFKDILQSPEILKVFFDARKGEDALRAQYGIKMQRVREVQLMECAARHGIMSLGVLPLVSKCLEDVLEGDKKDEWIVCKEKGEALWNPEKSGSYSVFNIRPLSKEIITYCVGRVRYLPELYTTYLDPTDDLIVEETPKRVAPSQIGCQPEGPERELSPLNAERNGTLDSRKRNARSGPEDYISQGSKRKKSDGENEVLAELDNMVENMGISNDCDRDDEMWTRLDEDMAVSDD